MPDVGATPQSDTIVTNLNSTTFRTLVPSLDDTTDLPSVQSRAGDRRLRMFTGATIHNLDSVAATVVMRTNDGTTQVEFLRVTLNATNYRLVLTEDDAFSLGSTLAVEVALSGATTTTALVGFGHYEDQ